MSIRFAAPVASLSARTRPSSTTLAFPRPANDNTNGHDLAENMPGANDTRVPLDPLASTLSDTRLAAALRYFGAYGLAAAEQAHAEACKAFAESNKSQFVRWRDICRSLDRRLARSLPNVQDMARVN